MLSVDRRSICSTAPRRRCASVSLKAEIGRVTCVMGRNGVGKILAAARDHRPAADRGRRDRLEGRRTSRRCPPHQRARRGIGYVPQGREIFPAAHGAGESA